MCKRLHSVNARYARSVQLRGEELRAAILALPPNEREEWVNGALGIEGVSPEDEPLPRGSVPYLPCAVDDILAVAAELRPDDVLVDLGSGLGRVVILAHLLSGARAHGIEIQRSLVEKSRARAAALKLDGVTFAHGDAGDHELDGSVFFLYSPFNGDMMTRVLARLEHLSRRRHIRVCAVGVEFRQAKWLVPRPTESWSTVFYDSRAPETA